MSVFFSVVIPLYNKGNHIKSTLESVLSQSFQDFEIVVVNDGSTDYSEREVLQLANPKVKYFSTENSGPSSARNFGIKKAQGTLIALLDADDYWFPNHLEDIFLLYQKHPEAGIFATNYEFYYSEKKIERPWFLDIPPNHNGLIKNYFKSSYIYRLATSSSIAIYKNIFNQIGGFDTSISSGQDIDMWIRIAVKYPVAFCGKISARYCMHTDNRISLTSTQTKTFPRLSDFKYEELKDPWLSKFLDLYRSEFALKLKLAGDRKQFLFYKNALNQKNISLKTKILLNTPAFMLRGLYKLKKTLEKFGVSTSAYH